MIKKLITILKNSNKNNYMSIIMPSKIQLGKLIRLWPDSKIDLNYLTFIKLILHRISIIIFDMSQKENVRKIRTVASFLKRTYQLLMVLIKSLRIRNKGQQFSGLPVVLAFMFTMRTGFPMKYYPNISNIATILPSSGKYYRYIFLAEYV